MPETLYRVQLEEIFEGPMDLLVHLIRKNELDIYDIPIALITEQYLEYLEWMQAMNIDFAGDFLLMASTLTQLKSRMLLPVHEGEDEEEDVLQEITRPLVEYLQMKSAADQLAERNLLGEKTFIRRPDRGEFLIGSEDEFIKIGLFELIGSDPLRVIKGEPHPEFSAGPGKVLQLEIEHRHRAICLELKVLQIENRLAQRQWSNLGPDMTGTRAELLLILILHRDA